MVRRTREELLGMFEHGDIPTEENFRDLIDSTFVLSDIQFYGTEGIAEQPIKMFAGQTTVYNDQGHFELDYGHVGFSHIVSITTTPIHDSVPNDASFVISAIIALQEPTSAIGKAFISGDVTTSVGEHQGPAPIGSKINFFVIGI